MSNLKALGPYIRINNKLQTAILLFSCLTTSAISTIASANDLGEVFVLRQGVYALDTTYDRGFRSSAYLPHTTLVFKEGTVRDIGTKTYERVITQFGQQVYIPRSSIAGQFKDLYGNQEYIFHADEYMCPSEEPECDEDTSIPISRGDVAEILDETSSGRSALRIHKHTDIDGYITSSKLQRLLAQGWVTDTRVRYPKYMKLSHNKIDALSTDCGVTKKSISKATLKTEVSAGISISSVLKSIFGIEAEATVGASSGLEKELSQEIGSSDHSYDVGVLKIQDNEQNAELTYFTSAKYRCLISGPHKQKLFVEELMLFDNSGTLRGFFSFEQLYGWSGTLTPDSAPYRLFGLNNRRAFFTSINSHGEYWRVFQKFYDELKNVSLSAILMSEFNASCPRQKQQDGSFTPTLCRQKLRVK